MSSSLPQPAPRLSGKVAIVTGGGSGFGRGIAAKFVAEGAHVVIADVAAEAGAAAAAELNAPFAGELEEEWASEDGSLPPPPPRCVSAGRTDVTSRADWEALLALTLSRFGGRLDVVVNNAGAAYANKASEEVTEADFDLVMAVNVKSVWLASSVLLPYFLAAGRPGVFLQVASTAGVRPRPRLTWYNASKAAVINATKTLAVEYGPKNIRFNSVSPVVGSTGMTHLFIGKPDTPENRKAFESVVPLGRGSTPADVANACCYLASDEAAFITGANIEVDGGRCV